MWHYAAVSAGSFPVSLRRRKQIIVPSALADWWEMVRIPLRIREAAELNPSLSPH